MNKLFRSVRLQLTFWYIGSISLLILLFGGSVLFGFELLLLRNLDQLLSHGGQLFAEKFPEYSLKDERDPSSLYEAEDKDHDMLIEKIDEELRDVFFVDNSYAQVLKAPDDAGSEPQLLLKSASLEERELPFSQDTLRHLQEPPFLIETVSGVFDFPLRVLSISVHDRDGRAHIVQLALPLQSVRNTLGDLLFVFAALFPGMLIVLSGLGYIFMKRAFSPVKNMVNLTKSITAEDLSLRIDAIESRDEIGELAETLNGMIARLEHSFKQIQQFSGDVAHELKTPLAELKCNAEVALRRKRTSGEYRQILENVIEDSEALQHIIEDLLLLAKLDDRQLRLSLSELALDELFLACFEKHHPLANEKRLAIIFEKMEPVKVLGDRNLLEHLLSNLLINAVKYTPQGGRLTLAVYQEGDRAILRVADNGVGIADKHLPFIFDRFYRVDRSRSQDTGGSGLGLAIAKKVVELHHGKISVQSCIDQGSTFQASLPFLSS